MSRRVYFFAFASELSVNTLGKGKSMSRFLTSRVSTLHIVYSSLIKEWTLFVTVTRSCCKAWSSLRRAIDSCWSHSDTYCCCWGREQRSHLRDIVSTERQENKSVDWQLQMLWEILLVDWQTSEREKQLRQHSYEAEVTANLTTGISRIFYLSLFLRFVYCQSWIFTFKVSTSPISASQHLHFALLFYIVFCLA